MHRRPPRTRLVAATLATALAGTAAVATATAGHAAAAGCRVAYTVGAQWGGGFTGDVGIAARPRVLAQVRQDGAANGDLSGAVCSTKASGVGWNEGGRV
ncbi:hypothetical protein [Phytohabitans suffuscus]|uniref:Uncharacterized protein n=1 Tax=Phytohabitans suffuscus TaxID=624315 RepID=A0A6F8YAF8_9ACTN|nr:hypothetical protein [Phytohabitans suffuscus]BCB83040.1 hypothetical protein Psuf_003530 [Phytohabitans suffuscus]